MTFSRSFAVVTFCCFVLHARGNLYDEDFEGISVGAKVADHRSYEGVVWNETNTGVVANGRTGQGYGVVGSSTNGSANVFGNWEDQLSFAYRCRSDADIIQYGVGTADGNGGCTVASSATVQNFRFQEIETSHYLAQELITSGLLYNGFGYYGMQSSPGQVLKIDLQNMERVGSLVLDPSEMKITCSLEYNGFGYFMTDGPLFHIVKVDLNTFQRVGSLPMVAGETFTGLKACTVYNGFGYFGTYSQQKIVKVDLNTFQRVSTLAIPRSAGVVTAMSHNGFGYFGTASYLPQMIWKVDYVTFQIVANFTLNDTEDSVSLSVANGNYGYFATSGAKGLVKISLDTMQREDTLPLCCSLTAATIYNDSMYFGGYRNGIGTVLIKVDLDFTNVTVNDIYLGPLSAQLHFQADWSAAFEMQGIGYFASRGSPFASVIVKIDLESFQGETALSLPENPGSVGAALEWNGYGFFGTSTVQAQLMKVDLKNLSSIQVMSLPGRYIASNGAIAYNGYGFFGADSYPFLLYIVNLASFQLNRTITLYQTGISSAVEYNGFGYFTSGLFFVKVDLTTFQIVDSITTTDNVYERPFGFTSGHYGYFANYNTILKLDLDTFQVVNATNITSVVSSLRSMMLYGSNAYLGSDSYVVRVDLDTGAVTGSLFFNGTAQIDSIREVNGIAYIGISDGFTYTSTSYIGSVNLTSFTKIKTVQLGIGETAPIASLNYDGFIYFGANTNPPKIIKINLYDDIYCDGTWRQANFTFASNYSCATLGFNTKNITIDDLSINFTYTPVVTTGSSTTSGAAVSSSSTTDTASTTGIINLMTTGTTDGTTTGYVGTTSSSSSTTSVVGTSTTEGSQIANPNASSKGSSAILTIIIGVAVLVVVLIILVVILILYCKKRRYRRQQAHELREITTPTNYDSIKLLATPQDRSVTTTTNYDSITPIQSSKSLEQGSVDLPRSSVELKQPVLRSSSGLDADSWLINSEDIKVETELGRGSFGVVYKGKWRNQDVAVKQLLAYSSEAEIDQFFREAELMRRIKSHGMYCVSSTDSLENVVQLIGVCAKNPLSIVIKYYPNGSLLHYIRKNALSVPAILRILKGIAAGCDHLHQEKIVHRDLAARNVLLNNNLEAVVSDFGFARPLTSDVGKTETLIGPIKWLAPECLSASQYSASSDVWAFGVTAWEVITRKEPYEGMTLPIASMAVLTGKTCATLTFPSDCPESLVTLIQQCWNVEPSQRPTMQRLYDELCNIENAQ